MGSITIMRGAPSGFARGWMQHHYYIWRNEGAEAPCSSQCAFSFGCPMLSRRKGADLKLIEGRLRQGFNPQHIFSQPQILHYLLPLPRGLCTNAAVIWGKWPLDATS